MRKRKDLYALTAETKKKYVETGGSYCPFCGSDEIEYVKDYGPTCQVVSCNTCDKRWYEIYELVDIEEIR